MYQHTIGAVLFFQGLPSSRNSSIKISHYSKTSSKHGTACPPNLIQAMFPLAALKEVRQASTKLQQFDILQWLILPVFFAVGTQGSDNSVSAAFPFVSGGESNLTRILISLIFWTHLHHKNTVNIVARAATTRICSQRFLMPQLVLKVDISARNDTVSCQKVMKVLFQNHFHGRL